MITHWILVYFIFTQSGTVTLPDMDTTNYSSKSECQLHADAAKSASDSMVHIVCVGKP